MEGFCHLRKQTGSHRSCFPLLKWEKKLVAVPIHLDLIILDKMTDFSNYRPMIQKKLDVLGKAGLTRDDFSSADTTRVKVGIFLHTGRGPYMTV